MNGSTTREWVYTDSGGAPVLKVVRRDDGLGRKRIHQEHYNGSGWKKGGIKGARPLLRLPEIVGEPERRVIVVEGETCADAAGEAWPGAIATTWPGGSKAWSKADWTPLGEREVWVLADADDPGRDCASGIAELLHGQGCGVRIQLAEGDDGWDVADAVQDVGPEGARERIEFDLAEYHPPAGDPGYEPRRRDFLAEAVHQIEMANRVETGGVRLHTAGLADLFTGGLMPGELVVTAARPGGGKTMLWLVEVEAQLRAGGAVLFACLDTAPVICYARLVAAHTGKRWGDYFTDVARDQREDDFLAFARSHGNRFAMLDAQWTLPGLRAELLDWLASLEGGSGLVIVDTSNRISAHGDSYERHSRVAEGLANLAQEAGVALCALTHVNRGAGSHPALEHISNTGAAEQVADRVVILVPADVEKKGRPAWCPRIRMSLAKDRYPINRPEGRWDWNVTMEPQYPRVVSGWK